MRLYRWVRREDGAMVLSSRIAGRKTVKRLGTVTRVPAGWLWETTDGMWGAIEPTLGMAMSCLERRARHQ